MYFCLFYGSSIKCKDYNSVKTYTLVWYYSPKLDELTKGENYKIKCK